MALVTVAAAAILAAALLVFALLSGAPDTVHILTADHALKSSDVDPKQRQIAAVPAAAATKTGPRTSEATLVSHQPAAAVARAAAEAALLATRGTIRCPENCTLHGNCDERTGQCACPFTHSGDDCTRPRMPACELVEGEPINLSFLVSEKAWSRLRDVALDGDRRRSHPPFRWLGVLPCTCVLQAAAAFSLQSSPMAPAWPAFIERPFLSMQRVVCIDTRRSVRELWGEGERAGEPLRWGYVPIFAFLKQVGCMAMCMHTCPPWPSSSR